MEARRQHDIRGRATARWTYLYPTTNPYTGPQHAFATPEQVFTSSGSVVTVDQSFDVTDAGITYYVGFACDAGGEDGAFEVWIRGLLP